MHSLTRVKVNQLENPEDFELQDSILDKLNVTDVNHLSGYSGERERERERAEVKCVS